MQSLHCCRCIPVNVSLDFDPTTLKTAASVEVCLHWLIYTPATRTHTHTCKLCSHKVIIICFVDAWLLKTLYLPPHPCLCTVVCLQMRMNRCSFSCLTMLVFIFDKQKVMSQVTVKPASDRISNYCHPKINISFSPAYLWAKSCRCWLGLVSSLVEVTCLKGNRKIGWHST